MGAASRAVIADAIAEMPVFNHHEHAWQSFSAEHGREFDLPFFVCNAYLNGDLEAAGWRREPDLFAYLDEPRLPDGAERAYRSLRPFLDRIRSTAYFRYLLRALNDLFDVQEEDVFSDGWREASARMRRYSREHRGGGQALSQRMGVRATILDACQGPAQLPPVDPGPTRVLLIARVDMFIHEERGLAATLAAYPAEDFPSWLGAFDHAFEQSLRAGAAGFKCDLAYNRRLEFANPSEAEAARVFQGGLLTADPAAKVAYQDFMVNRLCRLCQEAGVPLQIHTGMQFGLQTHTTPTLDDGNPALLMGLLRRWPELRADLLHGGFPWYIQGGLMAKYFPNVYIDGTWLHHISPSAYRAALTSWIETVPLNKILAWGGDHPGMLECSYASLAAARDLIADVLAGLVDNGYFGLDLALEVARRILYGNGASLWGLTEAAGDG